MGAAVKLGLGLGLMKSRKEKAIQFTFTATAADMDFGGILSTQTGESVLVDYGDGNTEIVTGTYQQLDHTYTVEQAHTIRVFNPDRLTKLDFGYSGNHNATQFNLSGDIESLQYGINLTFLKLKYTSVSGKVSALFGLINLVDLFINFTLISGDLSDLSNLTSLRYLWIDNTSVSNYISCTLGFTNTAINIQLDNLTGLDATEISNFLIDLDAIATIWTTPILDLTGCGEVYADLSVAGKAAYNSLDVEGWTITGL